MTLYMCTLFPLNLNLSDPLLSNFNYSLKCSRWLLAYRDAQSFRFSHYFISYLSELTLTMSGLGALKTNGDLRWYEPAWISKHPIQHFNILTPLL